MRKKINIIKTKLHCYIMRIIRNIRFIFDKKYKKRKIARLRYKKRLGSFNGEKLKRRRKRLFKINKVCFWCGKKMKIENATVDHIIPVSKGGNNKLSNLRLIHEDCRVQRDKFINKKILKV